MSAILGTYTRPDLILERGNGTRVWDSDGNEYLDFTAGIGVNALGHGHPAVADAVRDALHRGLIHTSNLYRTRPAEELADLLVQQAFPGKVFFCNSGAEATEAAFKFARRWAGRGRHEFVSFRGSFHGRLFGSLAATDRPGYQEPFQPLMPGVHFADVGDIDGVEAILAGGSVAGVIIEPVQGEGGVLPVPVDFLRSLRALCDKHDTLLIFDEVQCGLGRTGRMFAHQHAGVTPDLLTLAKPLGGGLPMGAVVLAQRVAEAVKPGDHATTFGGGPLVASAAVAVMQTLGAPGFLDGVSKAAEHLLASLAVALGDQPHVLGTRGLGLMQGVVLDAEAGPVVSEARALGLLVVSAGPQVVRLLPPLNVSPADIEAGVDILGRALRAALPAQS